MLEASRCDVGYSALPMPQHKLSIVGGRPFSKAMTLPVDAVPLDPNALNHKALYLPF